MDKRPSNARPGTCDVCGKPACIVLGQWDPPRGGAITMRRPLPGTPLYPRCIDHANTSANKIEGKC